MARNPITARFLKIVADITRTMTAEEMCEKLSFSASLVSRMKRGSVTTVKPEYIVEVCHKYKYSVLWVMTGRGEMKADESTRSIQEEIKHIKEILGDIIVALLNEIIKVEVTYKPSKKTQPDVIKELLKNIHRQ